MASVIKTETRKTKCPCCGSSVDANNLGRAGLMPELLEKLGKQIHDGTLEETFAIAESVKRQMDPSATSTELIMQQGFAQGFAGVIKPLNQMQNILAQMAGGTGIKQMF